MKEKKPKLTRAEKKQRKRERAYTQSMPKKIIKTTLDGVIAIGLIGVLVVGNGALSGNYRIVNSILGGISKSVDNSGSAAEGLNLNYNESEFSSEEELSAVQTEFAEEVASEGIVLLQNNDNALPVSSDTTFSIFSANAPKLTIGASIMDSMMGGGSSLKEVFEDAGVSVNETLWDFYAEDASDYGLASGSVSYGDAEDFAINECPLSELESAGVLDSVEGTTPVYLLKRVAGEGRDMPRSMYNHADNEEDQAKTYLEPDSTELEILQYLNDNYDNTILVVNSNAALELDFLANFPNIKAVVYAPDGLQALPEVLTGEVNPSGRTVDTFAADALASPAAQNFGDYQYSDESGELTKYNYVSYEEGIYVGYRYYETRYEDVVLGRGNAGDFDYDEEVVYPFGYGLSYTEFEWSNYSVTWDGTEATVSVDVTNTGSAAGKDVVEIYAQSPYTEYDQANGIEKASVELVSYEKTEELMPGETQTVTATFDQEQLKAYDSTGAETYILDAGTYYITAAANAHDAVNNILAAKGANAEGNTELTAEYVPDNADVDTVTYSTDSYSGAEITNLFDDAAGDVTYLTRSDWTGTFPTHDGEASSQISTWGNEINGDDGVSYTYTKTASDELIAQLDSLDSGNPETEEDLDTEIVYGEDNGLTLIQMRGLDYDDPLWDDLLDQLTAEDYWLTIEEGGYGTEFLESVNKPFDMDADTASGLMYGGAGDNGTYPNPMTLAQTYNKSLALRYGEMIGEAALVAGENGADGWYAPSMNIHRTPFSGRNGEYYSEDPLVSGTTASQEVYGAAGKGMYTFIKHFAFNDQEDHRGDRNGQYSVATWLNEQSAREIYLLPFEMCMKVGDVELNYIKTNDDGTYEEATTQIRACQAVMTAFNRIGATWTGGSYNLITGILRNEWAFNGFVLTDNANTSVFMSSEQMLAAGADAKLTYGGNEVRTDFDSTSVSDYTYGREAMHRILYTVANSKAMNGLAPDGVFKDTMMISEKLIAGLAVVFGLIILGLCVRIVKRFKKPASLA